MFVLKGIESLPQILVFLFSFFCETQCHRPKIFQTMNSMRSNNISLKYQRFTTSGCKDLGIRKISDKDSIPFL